MTPGEQGLPGRVPGQGAKKKMGLIAIAVMRWMEILDISLGRWDHRKVMGVCPTAVVTSHLQKRMKSLLNIEEDSVESLSQFPPFFLPHQVRLG